jgi:phosphoesterase RecJ-like protein
MTLMLYVRETMNNTIKEEILDKIKEYKKIALFRHTSPDGDCIGATKGLQSVIRNTWNDKEVYIIDPSTSSLLDFMGADALPVSDVFYEEALAIVLDTATSSRISSDKYTLCREIIKIDHHIPVENYGELAWVEEERSSCCEMIVDFCMSFSDVLRLDTIAATHLYTGMVTDSGRFKHNDVTGNTLRCAAHLIDKGVDTEKLFARLYLEPYEGLKFKATVYEKLQITDNGVAYVYIDKDMQEEFGLTYERASGAISMLDSIRGALCWIAFIENASDNSIRVRVRSRFLPTNGLSEQFRGGGHAYASGATLRSADEIDLLLSVADSMVKEYKENNEGWI